jgi:type II secretory pathway pseudopilin PulG
MNRRHAFTLVELLLALTITTILVVLLVNVVSATLNAWQQGRNRLDTFSTARQLMGRITDEMSAAVAASGRMEFVENSSSIGDDVTAAPPNSENVFFVAPYPNLGSGDLCVIAYRHNAATRRLERRFKDSAGAWNVAAADRYKAASYPDPDPTEWRTVAQGVTEFEIRSYSQEDVDAGTDPAEDTWNSGGTVPAMVGKTPRRIVLRLKVVDDRTLARMDSLSDDAITRAAREFHADFRLPAR